jgi:tetratricopeptide (TPR) repeat protein
MSRKIPGIILILLFLTGLTSCRQPSASWDDPISDEQKAEFLLATLKGYYREAVTNEDFTTLLTIQRDANWVARLDRTRKDEIAAFEEDIDKAIDKVKATKLKRINYYREKNWFVSTTIEYKQILIIEPFNKEAKSYIREKKDDINKYIKDRKTRAKVLLSKKYFLAAAKELKKLPELVPGDLETKRLLARADRLKREKIRKLLKLGKELTKEEDYARALKTTEEILKLDPDNTEALVMRSEAKKMKGGTKKKSTSNNRATTRKKASNNDTARYKGYFEKAKKYFDDKRYAEARDEIETFLSLTTSEEAIALQKKINKSLNTQVSNLLDNAVLLYNSQKYEDALEEFKQVLYLDPGNEAAEDYRSRIEKMMRAFQ